MIWVSKNEALELFLGSNSNAVVLSNVLMVFGQHAALQERLFTGGQLDIICSFLFLLKEKETKSSSEFDG